MKKTLMELFDQCEPEELDQLLPGELNGTLPEGAMERIQSRALEKAFPKAEKKKRSKGRLWLRAAVAACLVLMVGLVGVAYAAEAREYGAAVQFFDENGLSTDGLSREDVKAVYRDIITQRFTYEKTAEVIERSVAGVEIFQREPTPEELAELWNSKDPSKNPAASPWAELDYRFEYVDRMDEELGFEVFDRCYLNHYEDGVLIWRAEFDQFCVTDWTLVSGGVAVSGETSTWNSEQPKYAWLARVDDAGDVLWEAKLDHGFQWEYIAAVIDNGDGTWAVLSRGDYEVICLSQYSDTGEELSFHRVELGKYGIQNAVQLGEGYLVQLKNYMDDTEPDRLVKMDREGGVTDSFSYEGKDCDYYLTDMAEFNGRVYLSAYATSKLADEERYGPGRHEIENLLNDLFDNDRFDITSEELTPMVRDNYTAVLLVCGPEGGAPETFYSIKGSLGAGLAVNEQRELVWDVESVVNTFFSPATNSFTIGGDSQVFRYTFDSAGTLIRQEDTGELVAYRR